MKSVDGFKVVDSEVSLLRLAATDDNLLVQGRRLCEWARLYFTGRLQQVDAAQTIRQRLHGLVRGLADTEADLLAKRLQDSGVVAAHELDERRLIGILCPDFAWHAQPSPHHAAAFLVWLIRSRPDSAVQKLIEPYASYWEATAQAPINAAYSARSTETARERFIQWIGLGNPDLSFPPFPAEMPIEEADLRKALRELSVRTNGRAHENLGTGAPGPIYSMAAECDYRYLENNPEYLSREVLNVLTSVLPGEQVRRLQTMIPQPIPSSAPHELEEMFDWFRGEYLPYRTSEWAAQSASRDVRSGTSDELLDVIDGFVARFLGYYADGLYGGRAESYINHIRMGALLSEDPESRTHAIFIVLLDGLGAFDGPLVQRAIENSSSRFQTISNELVFSTLPTITQFGKRALLTGKPPSLADSSPPHATVNRLRDVQEALRRLNKGEVVIWSVVEPDKSYHNAPDSATAWRDSQSRLEGVGKQVAELAGEVPASVPLRILICTDHGRLMATSRRTLQPPEGWNAQGRAAWGIANRAFGASGVHREGNLLYLDAQRFRLPADVAVVSNGDAYLTEDGRSGFEVSPHGGVFPEEVLVPWILVGRDQGSVEVRCEVLGSGRARQLGKLNFKLGNFSDIPVTAIELVLVLPGREPRRFPLGVSLMPMSTEEVEVTLDDWPSPAEAAKAVAQLHVALANERRFRVESEIAVTSHDIYQQDDLLDDLT